MKFVLFTYGVITKNNKQSFKLNVYELNNKTQFDYPFAGHFEKRSVLNLRALGHLYDRHDNVFFDEKIYSLI